MPQFVRRERKHKKLARAKEATSNSNSNVGTIVPESQSEREARRQALKDELRAAQPESKVSSKKRKRLEKYVETKLKKEENADLLRKLEEQRVDTSLLKSSRALGRVRESQREKLQRAIKERDAGIGVPHVEGSVLYQPRPDVDGISESDDEVGWNSDEENGGVSVVLPVRQLDNTAFGSGLKRPLEVDGAGRPLIRKRKRRKKEKQDPSSEDQIDVDAVEDVVSEEDIDQPSGENTNEDEEEWNGFGSDADNDGAESPELDDNPYSSTSSDEQEIQSDSDELSTHSSTATSADEKPARLSAFKAWADSQRNAAIGFTPSANPNTESESARKAVASFKPRNPSPEPLLASIPLQQGGPGIPAAAITITRSQDIQAARMELPVVQEEQRIVEAITYNPVVVVCGATGSGKTTQVPQMLLENGYGSSMGSKSNSNSAQSKGMIGVTQPRRVAATSVATRVAHEVGPEFSRKVAHQVRYDTSVGRDTAIKFMTDGILLREIQQDFILSKYSVVVIDEAHERSVNTDILIGVLSRIVVLRAELAREEPTNHYPLKLVIMSATLSQGVDSFLKNERLWNPVGGAPPVVEVEGRQFPVTVHFTRKTRRDYVDEVVEKVARGHRKLPPGGMLVFLTGQQEIQTMAQRLRDKIGGYGRIDFGVGKGMRSKDEVDDFEDGNDVIKGRNNYLEGEEDAGSDSEVEIKLDHAEDTDFALGDTLLRTPGSLHLRSPLRPHILPLYAALPATQQLKIFQPTPEGSRMIVLATNVAETSLTIPGIKYVFDTGRVKEKKYDVSTGVQTFEVDWISKASAEQRKGRAGRVGPGHVWRMYSSAIYEEFFQEETVPEILRTPLESTILQLKTMEIENVLNFPFPTSPERIQLEKAERLLRSLGMIKDEAGFVTEMGKNVMKFPVSPRFGRMLVLARRNGVVEHAIALVAALAIGEVFVPEMQSANPTSGRTSSDGNTSDEESGRLAAAHAAQTISEKSHQAYTRSQATLARWDDRSDAIKLLTAVGAHAEAQTQGRASAFSKEFWLREKGMEEVQMLRRQLQGVISDEHTGEKFNTKLSVPDDKDRTMLNQIIAAGYIDQVAIRADLLNEERARKPRRAIEVPYRTLFPSAEDPNVPSERTEEKEMRTSVFVHPSSVLARLSAKEMPHYVVYSHLSRAAPSSVNNASRQKRTRMHPITAIGAKALAALAEDTPLLQFGKPVSKIEELERDDKGRQRRQCWVGISLQAPGSGMAEWPLGAWKVVQRRGRKDWVVEKVIAR